MQIWMILWKKAIKRGLLLPRFLLTSEQLGLMTFLVKASLERLYPREQAKPQNKTVSNCHTFDWFEVKTMVLNAWFSSQFYRNVNIQCLLSLTVDKLNFQFLSLVGFSSTWQGSGHPTPTSRQPGRSPAVLNIPPASWAENPSSGGTKHHDPGKR